MIDIKQAEIPIDDTITVLRRHVQGGDVYNSMMSVGRLADLIDRHRQLCKNEIEGLKGDVKAAEAAYEREKVRADNLSDEKDRWTNECLPGWRKRVSESERKERETWAAYDSNVAELKALALHVGDLEQDRDEWKRDAATSETKLEKAIMQRDASRRLVESLMTAGKSLNNGEPMYAMDPGAPEGDKTVITFECCNVKHTFSPPKTAQWNHTAECHECGAKTTIKPDMP